jgi:hypothetical protein
MFALNVLQGRIIWKGINGPYTVMFNFPVIYVIKLSTERTLT